MAITMQEIAEKLNLSIATVSRALSGKDDSVSDDTRKMILETAEKYGYKRRKRTIRNIAFFIDRTVFQCSSQFYAGIIAGVEEELIKRKYVFQFNSIEENMKNYRDVGINIENIVGAIFAGRVSEELVLSFRSMGVPVVLIDFNIPTEEIDSVLIDDVDGIVKAFDYLYNLGHRRIGYVSLDGNEESVYNRLTGYRRALEMHNLPLDENLIERCLGLIYEGFEAMDRMMERNREFPTAVIAYNDIIAIGAIDSIKQKGLKVPQDISVVGFDDIGIAREVVPPLTTLHVPKRAMGIIAVQHLSRLIEGKKELVKKVLVPARLKVRKSTAAVGEAVQRKERV